MPRPRPERLREPSPLSQDPAIPSVARSTLRDLGVRPSRRYGQSFLVSPSIADAIVAAAEPEGKEVVEIGPGLGALTVRLAATARRVLAVEIDSRLADHLRGLALPGVEVLTADALDVSLDSLAAEGCVVVGNLPYSIGTVILERLCEMESRVPRAVLMLQREVAERLTARPDSKSYGALTVLVAFQARVRAIRNVPASAFHPRPKVSSTVLEIDFRDPRTNREVRSADAFREVVRAGFGKRRKMLRGSLGCLLDSAEIESAGVDPSSRAESLDLEAFARLANALHAKRVSGAGSSRGA